MRRSRESIRTDQVGLAEQEHAERSLNRLVLTYRSDVAGSAWSVADELLGALARYPNSAPMSRIVTPAWRAGCHVATLATSGVKIAARRSGEPVGCLKLSGEIRGQLGVHVHVDLVNGPSGDERDGFTVHVGDLGEVTSLV